MDFLNKTHVVVDLETLAIKETAVILSLGAVPFCFEDYHLKYDDLMKNRHPYKV